MSDPGTSPSVRVEAHPEGPALPKGRVIDVRFSVALPHAASREQAEEWIAYNIGARQDCRLSNPLVDFDMDAEPSPLLTDTFRERSR